MTTHLKLAEAERALGVTRWTLYRYIHQGRLPASRLPGGHFRVSAAAVAALQSALRAELTSAVDGPGERAAEAQQGS